MKDEKEILSSIKQAKNIIRVLYGKSLEKEPEIVFEAVLNHLLNK